MQTMSNLKESFEQKGYAVVDTKLDATMLDELSADLDSYFGENAQPVENVAMIDHNRVQDAWYINQKVLKVAQCEEVLRALKHLYGAEMRPFQTLNFYKGTEQAVHADSIHFNSEPFGAMCGVWVALEDVGEDQGPLIYYPGSQRLPEINFSDLGLESSTESYGQYLGELEKIIQREGYEPEYGILKKGQALIWSANLFHGGSKQLDPSRTRKSQVTHFYQSGVKYWRPTQSSKSRKYFDPDWVRDVSKDIDLFGNPAVPPKPNLLRRAVGKFKRTFFR